jgi:hypothetical protein
MTPLCCILGQNHHAGPDLLHQAWQYMHSGLISNVGARTSVILNQIWVLFRCVLLLQTYAASPHQTGRPTTAAPGCECAVHCPGCGAAQLADVLALL